MVSRFFRPGDPFSQLHREVNRVFDEVVRTIPTLRGGFAPDIDLHDTPTGLEMTVELPGLSEDDIDLRLEGDSLLLSGEKKSTRERDELGAHLTERGWGRFQRTVRLPFAPDEAQVEARFDRGVLHIAIPRPTRQTSQGRIRINPGAANDAATRSAEMATTPNQATGTTKAATDYTSHTGEPPAPGPGARVEPGVGHATLTATGGDSSGTSSGVQDPAATPTPAPTPAAQGGATQGGVPTRHSDQAHGTPSKQSRDEVEEASRGSFPASDPPANTGITGATGTKAASNP